MHHLEDIFVGDSTDCGSFAFSRDDIVGFARRYDPQPFHLDELAAAQSLFGGLSASSLQSASASRKLAIQHVLSGLAFVGSPGAGRVHMIRPVLVGTPVAVRYTVGAVGRADRASGAGLVEGVLQGVDGDGNVLMKVETLDWIASKDAPNPPVSAVSTPPSTVIRAPSGDPAGGEKSPLYFEDCAVNTAFVSGEDEVGEAVVAQYRQEFDPGASFPDGRPIHNEWHGPSLGTKQTFDAFWSRSKLAGGTGMVNIRWPASVQPGDRLRTEVRITGARSSNSRPKLGLIDAVATCVNQRSDVVFSYATTAFLWKRT